MDDVRRGAPLPRRRMLKALAVAPAVLAGCAAVSAEQAADGGAPGGDAPAARAARPAGVVAADEALAAIRSFPLEADAEPAFVFRAAAVRPGDRR